MSQFAVQEYEDLQENLNLERDLRAEAENFAREVGFVIAFPGFKSCITVREHNFLNLF